MSIREIKQYMEYCLQGQDTIPERKEMLEQTRQQLTEKIKVLQGQFKIY